MKNIVFGVLVSIAALFTFSATAHATGHYSIPGAALFSSSSNSIGMWFITLPSGSFYMGTCGLTKADVRENKKRKFLGLTAKEANCPSGVEDVNGERNELPQHKVRISKEFQMGITEVLVGQFKQFIVAAGRDDLLTSTFLSLNRDGDDVTVIGVSWDDAQDFINWLNKKEGGTAIYRLPTEAEWEYAARAGTTSPYYWGNNAGGGEDKFNDWGLYYMSGNVWEWVQDWYDEDYYDRSPATDPQGPSSGRSRVLRGGSDISGTKWRMRSAYRTSMIPKDRGDGSWYRSYGFRLVRQW